jgi:tRNA(fMet)-specific endonuclease VapC
VKPSLLDTDTLSFFFKGHPSVVSTLEAYSRQYGRVNLSIITYYEILSGLKHRDANKKLEVFLDFAAQNTVLSLTKEAATIASEHYATLCKQGQPLEDIDLLIAGIALSNNLILVTHNTKHFERIKGLEIADWTLDFHKRTENAER